MIAAVPPLLDDLRERFVEQLIAGEAREAQGTIAQALHQAPAAAVYQRLLSEALYEVGRRWQRGETTIAEEHIATGIAEVVLAQVAFHLPRAPRRRRTAIVACAPSELHAVGSRVVGDFIDAAGWDVLQLGALTPAGALCELVVSRNAEVVALSAATTDRLPDVAEALERLRALPRPPFIAVGGQAFATAAAAALVRDDAVFVRTPEALVAALDERFPRDDAIAV